jgi:hypothetical protein
MTARTLGGQERGERRDSYSLQELCAMRLIELMREVFRVRMPAPDEPQDISVRVHLSG